MRILVPIFRFNWYRTLAPVVDECMRRGHEVTCLHNESDRNFESNRPNEKLFPQFRHGTPKINGYRNDEELDQAILYGNHEALISIDLPLRRWIDDPRWAKRKFRYIAVTTPDTLKRLHDRESVEAVDCFALRSEYELSATLLDRTTDYGQIFETAQSLGRDGKRYTGFLEPRLGKEWTEDLVEDFKEKVRICGYPLLDAENLIDREAVRKRLKIPEGQPVIGFWATPTAGRGSHASWDWLFSENRMPYFYAKAFKAYGLAGMGKRFVCEEKVVRAVYDFSRKNDAFLITKLRHYQKPGESLFSTFTDGVVGEDSYYPHTALELASIADVMIGFTTSGTPEAVWAGSAVIDINPPGSQREMLYQTLHFWDGMLDAPGVVWSKKAEDLVESLPQATLEDYRIDPIIARNYKSKYCGPEGASFSANVLDAVEEDIINSRSA